MKKWIGVFLYFVIGICTPLLADQAFDAGLQVTAWALIAIWAIWALSLGILVFNGAKNAGKGNRDSGKSPPTGQSDSKKGQESPPNYLT